MAYENRINFASDFTDMPIGRYREDGNCSGEVFREEHLLPALRLYGDDEVIINVDGVYGMGGSFVEEAFGGLIRLHGYDAFELMDRIVIEGSEYLEEEIFDCIKEYIGYNDEE